MGKDPAYLYYYRDFMSATYTWDDAEVGAYQRALNCQADNGHLTEADLRKILNTSWNRVSSKFIQDKQGLYYNERLECEIEKRKKYCEMQAQRVGNRWGKNDKPLSGKRVRGNTVVLPNAIPNAYTRDANANDSKIVPEYRECSDLLKARILERRQQKITEAILYKWDNDVRLMIKQDSRTVEQIKALINECHDMEPGPTGFTWRNNILSMGKLRERWNEGKIYVGMNKMAKTQTPKPEFERKAVGKYDHL